MKMVILANNSGGLYGNKTWIGICAYRCDSER